SHLRSLLRSRRGQRKKGKGSRTKPPKPRSCALTPSPFWLSLALRRGRHRFNFELTAHPVDQLLDVKRLVQEIVRSGELQLLDFVVLDHAADAEDAHVFQGRVGPHPVTYFLAVDVRQHDVEDNQVRPIFLDHHACIEAIAGYANFKAAVLLQDLGHQLDQFCVIIDQKDFALATFQGIGRNAVVSHKAIQGLARDAAEAGTGYPESLQLTIVKTTDDGL